MDVLISIHSKYVRLIQSGEKLFEFRKSQPKKEVNKIWIYETSPTSKVIGWFQLGIIHQGTAKELSKKCNYELSSLLDYLGKKNGFALHIEKFNPVSPFSLDFLAPRGFRYIPSERWSDC